ncbi:uncharacterized [Tachysurus ichikawai]
MNGVEQLGLKAAAARTGDAWGRSLCARPLCSMETDLESGNSSGRSSMSASLIASKVYQLLQGSKEHCTN